MKKMITRRAWARSAAAAAMTCAAGAAAGQTTYIETFDDGMNHSGWSWDRTALGGVVASGGNPGGYFESALMAVPALFSSGEQFTGDFRARGVGSIGGDLRGVQFAAPEGMISISLMYNNGTPENPFDDTYATYVSSIPSPVNPDMGWVSFDFEVPSASLETPEGWQLSGVLPQLPPTATWDQLITNVNEVIIAWNNPLEPVLLFDVVRGADNLRITYDVPGPGAAAGAALLGVLAAARRRRAVAGRR